MKTVGLCMIVKNEAKVVLRCLESVRPLIDYALVVDTGSSDGTQAIVKDNLSRTGLPGEAIDEAWQDFAYNRSFALTRLRENTGIDYALVMDADDVLVFADGFEASNFKDNLDKDFFHMEIRLGCIRFWRAQILSNRLDFIYKGVLHEFVVGPRAIASSGMISGLYVQAGVDGARSCNPDKYHEDALTLEKALETETDEFVRARYCFYLGQSWMNAGEKEKALRAFLRRADLGAFHDEVSLSLYHAAQIKDELGYPDTEVIFSYLKAYEADPKRAEPLHGAMDYCRRNNKPFLGYLIGKHAVTIPEPVGALFVAAWIYDYGLLEEFSVAAYQSGHYKECAEAIHKLLVEAKVPKEVRPRLRKNARVAVQRQNTPTIGSARAAS